MNSTNIVESRKGESAYRYIEAIKRDLAKTGKVEPKSPIDQSFIKNIDCYESSPYLLSQTDLEPFDPEEQEMSQRAMEFLEINLKLKAFESLIANTMVLLKAKEYRMKADMQNRSVLLQRSFTVL
jgi:hypothetical protein